MHFIALDMNVYFYSTEIPYQPAQHAWLEADLKAAVANRDQVPWIIIGAHYPMYSSSITLSNGLHNDGGDEVEENALLDKVGGFGYVQQKIIDDVEPLMKTYGVDLYISGHEHSYESIYPVWNGTVVDKSATAFQDPLSPVHIITGAGGGPGLDTFGPPLNWTRKQLAAWGYGRLIAHNSSTIVYEHVLNNNDTIYDTIVVTKKDGKHGPW